MKASSLRGWLGYHNDWERDDQFGTYEGTLFDEDVFWYWEPAAALEINLSRSFRVTGSAGYRFTNDFQILNTTDDAFEGWTYSLGFKIRRF